MIQAAPLLEPTQATTHQAYWVSTPRVAVIGRNNRTGLQVWSGEHGYPGDPEYREFHKKDGVSGLQYWRITGPGVGLGAKDVYLPEQARERLRQHAQHFRSLVEQETADYADRNGGRFGLISSAYDTELFGHWWFEGVEWIGEVLRSLADSPSVELTTASEYVRKHPPEDVLALPESSWGQGGTHFTWQNVDTEWMWPIIHATELDMEQAVGRHPSPSPEQRALLDQMARELLLLQSSDWPFLVTTGQAREYAEQRFQSHVERFERCRDALEASRGDSAAGNGMVRELFERDNVFPSIDPAAFRERQGRA